MKWHTVKLGSVTCKVGSGATPRGGEVVYQQSGVPLIRSMNVHFDGFHRDGLVYIDDDEASKLDHVSVKSDDVLFNITGASIGRVTIAPTDMAGARVNQHVCIIRPTNELAPRFLAYFLRSPEQQALIGSNQVGGTRQAVTKAMLLNWKIHLPPIGEQERLVGLLDEAVELQTLRAQADRRTAVLIPALFHEMFGDPVENPMRHPVQKLEDICRRITDGTHQPPPFSENGIPFLFVRNIVSGFIDFDTEKFISEETFAELTRRVKPERGDILYSTVGSYGVAVQVETDRKFAFQRHIGHLKPNRAQVDSGFLTAQLNSPWLKLQADQSARGIAQKTVNLAEIRKFKVLVPPLSLQKEFAQRVSEIRQLQAGRGKSKSPIATIAKNKRVLNTSRLGRPAISPRTPPVGLFRQGTSSHLGLQSWPLAARVPKFCYSACEPNNICSRFLVIALICQVLIWRARTDSNR
jgi:type I restriction enzyme, S subunit